MFDLIAKVMEANVRSQEEEKEKTGFLWRRGEEEKEKKCLGKKWFRSFLIYTEG